MGKLSNVLLKSLFFISAEAQNETFAVTSCNADVSYNCTFRSDTYLKISRIIDQH